MITQSGLYAIRAAAALAQLPDGACKGAGRIARSAGLPASYSVKLLQVLARAGVVAAQKGPGGGFRLSRPAAQVTLWDVLEPVDDPARRNGCVLGQARCSAESRCAVHDRWSNVRGEYCEMLRRTTLADLAAHAADGPAEEFLSTSMRRAARAAPVEAALVPGT
jgi:Rrf2 family protein